MVKYLDLELHFGTQRRSSKLFRNSTHHISYYTFTVTHNIIIDQIGCLIDYVLLNWTAFFSVLMSVWMCPISVLITVDVTCCVCAFTAQIHIHHHHVLHNLLWGQIHSPQGTTSFPPPSLSSQSWIMREFYHWEKGNLLLFHSLFFQLLRYSTWCCFWASRYFSDRALLLYPSI